MNRVLLLTLIVLCISAKRDDSVMKLMLNQMELIMSGNSEFDPVFYKKLVNGMDD